MCKCVVLVLLFCTIIMVSCSSTKDYRLIDSEQKGNIIVLNKSQTFGGKVYFDGTVIIPNNVTITFEPRSYIMVRENCEIIVHGSLIAKGDTRTDAITITYRKANKTTNLNRKWRGISFIDSGENDLSELRYVNIANTTTEIHKRNYDRVSLEHISYNMDFPIYKAVIIVAGVAVLLWVGVDAIEYIEDKMYDACCFEGGCLVWS